MTKSFWTWVWFFLSICYMMFAIIELFKPEVDATASIAASIACLAMHKVSAMENEND